LIEFNSKIWSAFVRSKSSSCDMKGVFSALSSGESLRRIIFLADNLSGLRFGKLLEAGDSYGEGLPLEMDYLVILLLVLLVSRVFLKEGD